jgi:hypothetical protein
VYRGEMRWGVEVCRSRFSLLLKVMADLIKHSSTVQACGSSNQAFSLRT